jgi:hypothetical protein
MHPRLSYRVLSLHFVYPLLSHSLVFSSLPDWVHLTRIYLLYLPPIYIHSYPTTASMQNGQRKLSYPEFCTGLKLTPKPPSVHLLEVYHPSQANRVKCIPPQLCPTPLPTQFQSTKWTSRSRDSTAFQTANEWNGIPTTQTWIRDSTSLRTWRSITFTFVWWSRRTRWAWKTGFREGGQDYKSVCWKYITWSYGSDIGAIAQCTSLLSFNLYRADS